MFRSLGMVAVLALSASVGGGTGGGIRDDDCGSGCHRTGRTFPGTAAVARLASQLAARDRSAGNARAVAARDSGSRPEHSAALFALDSSGVGCRVAHRGRSDLVVRTLQVSAPLRAMAALALAAATLFLITGCAVAAGVAYGGNLLASRSEASPAAYASIITLSAFVFAALPNVS